MTSSRLVSIIIPAFNRADVIRETFDSVIAQTYPHWECIVVDDGSTDHTPEVVRSFVTRDSRFKFHFRGPDRPKGGNACRNLGFELSQGRYICWVDSDDLLDPKKIETQVGHLQNTDCTVSVTQASRFMDGSRIPYRLWREKIVTSNLTEDLIRGTAGWHTSSPLWSREVLPNQPFNEKLEGAQEWYFHILQSIRIPKASIYFDDTSTVFVRESRTSMTYATDGRQKAANYLDARTALMHEIHGVAPELVKPIADTARKLLKRIGNEPAHRDAIERFEKALFEFDRPRWLRLRGIASLNRIVGRGERLFNYL